MSQPPALPPRARAARATPPGVRSMSLLLRRKIKERLLELSPRAFEFFAGDLLEYLKLASVRVTRQTGDGGIDAECEMVSGGLLRVPAGVQVKRQRRTVYRPDIDRFVGALANRFSCGIFITTSIFAPSSLGKAASSIPHVCTVDGDQVAAVLVSNGIGALQGREAIDEGYFGMFEARLRVSESERPTYYVGGDREITEANDLISLRALSYALRVDTTTIRRWVERGHLQPDAHAGAEFRDGLFFRRGRIAEIRQRYGLQPIPSSVEEWTQEFLRFATRGRLNKSYKPVMLLAMLDLAGEDGSVDEDALARSFLGFYESRSEAGLPAEVASSILSRPQSVKLDDVRTLLVRYPLDRFVIKGFVEYLPQERLVRFRPEIWEGLRFRDVLELRRSLREQVDRYFASIAGGG